MRKALEHLKQAINGCTCDVAYKTRNLVAPDCFWCDNHEEIEEAMKAYAREALEVAAEKAEVKFISAVAVVDKESILNIVLP